MRKNCITFLILLLAFGFTSNGQTGPRVLFSTGGSFQAPGNKVKLYQYLSGTKTILDSVYGDFSNDLVVDGLDAYLHVGRVAGSSAGNDVIMRYNLVTNQREDSITNVSGAQRILVTPEHIVLTFGYGATSEYVRIYLKSSLNQIYADTVLTAFAADATFLNDSIYVGYTGTNNGALAVYSTEPPALIRTVSFDTSSTGVTAVRSFNNSIYLLSEKYNFVTWSVDYGAVTEYVPSTGSFISTLTQEGHGMISITSDTMYADFGTVNAYRLNPFLSTSHSLPSYTDAAFDPVQRKFYLQSSDFWSYGALKVYSYNGILLDSVSTDIAGSAIAIDHLSQYTAVQDIRENSLSGIYPNPTSSFINITGISEGEFQIFNSLGQHALKGDISGAIDVSSLAPGLYTIRIKTDTVIKTGKFIRQ